MIPLATALLRLAARCGARVPQPEARRGPLVWAALILGGALAGCGEESTEPRCGPSSAVVQRVIDGDTVELANGEKVRYLMVDAPEISSGKEECYGPEARTYNVQLVEGQTVELVYDAECTDRFGRLLAYVYVEGREVNMLLVQRGYGCVLYIAPNGEDRKGEFDTAELEARSLGRGLWGEGVCQENPCN